MSALTLAIAAATFLAAAPPSTGPSDVMLRSIRSDGEELRVAVSAEQLAKVPAWDAESDFDPPLARRLAIQLARDSVKKRYPQFEDFAVTSIEMAMITEERWYYFVKFVPKGGGERVHALGAIAVVLMDGTVVEPKRVEVAK